eukprot:scaffold1221_cov207-Amphora_coffeaeformis.AAC.10
METSVTDNKSKDKKQSPGQTNSVEKHTKKSRIRTHPPIHQNHKNLQGGKIRRKGIGQDHTNERRQIVRREEDAETATQTASKEYQDGKDKGCKQGNNGFLEEFGKIIRNGSIAPIGQFPIIQGTFQGEGGDKTGRPEPAFGRDEEKQRHNRSDGARVGFIAQVPIQTHKQQGKQCFISKAWQHEFGIGIPCQGSIFEHGFVVIVAPFVCVVRKFDRQQQSRILFYPVRFRGRGHRPCDSSPPECHDWWRVWESDPCHWSNRRAIRATRPPDHANVPRFQSSPGLDGVDRDTMFCLDG